MKLVKSYFFIGSLFLLVVMIDTIWWFQGWSSNRSFEENRALYLARFPEFLQDAILITLINIILLGISIFAFLKTQQANYLRTISVILLTIAGLLFLLNVFSLS